MTDKYKNEILETEENLNPVERTELRNIFSMFETVTSQPTEIPTRFQGQIKLWNDSGTMKICFFDTSTNTWNFFL